jgi:hypothetical protein
MKKVKNFLLKACEVITSAAIVILFVGLCLSGAIWAVKLLLGLIGVI